MKTGMLRFAIAVLAGVILAAHVADVDARVRPKPQPVRPVTPRESLYPGRTIPPSATTAAPAAANPKPRIDWTQVYRPIPQFIRPTRSHYTSDTGSKEVWTATTRAFGDPTRTPTDAYIALIVTESGEVVATTNYLKSGYDDAALIRLSSEDLLDSNKFATRITELLEKPDVVEQATLKLVVDADMNSPVLKTVFDFELQSFRINTAEFKHAELFLKDSDRVFGLEKIDRPNPPPRWAAKLNDCCVFTGVPPDFQGWDKLGAVPFEPRRAQVVSLFADSSTGTTLRQRGRPQDVTHPSQLLGEATDAIATIARSQPPGTPLVILGHTVGSLFRIEGIHATDVSFEFLTNIARDAKRPLVLLGCYSANHFSIPGTLSGRDLATGALNLLRPQEISSQIVTALESSSNFREVSEKLSSQNLYIWMSTNFMRDVHDGTARTLRAPIYKRMSDGIRSIVGFLFMYLPCTGSEGCSK